MSNFTVTPSPFHSQSTQQQQQQQQKQQNQTQGFSPDNMDQNNKNLNQAFPAPASMQNSSMMAMPQQSSSMMMTMNPGATAAGPGSTTNIYFATPLEQTFSCFLAQQIFGVILPVAGSISMTIHLDISGRNVVQLLTQSTVPRFILRSLWNVADPENCGSLRSLQQFQLLLRLVSLAQAQIIPHDESTADLSVDGLRSLVQQTAHQQLALPAFSNVIIPTNVQLQQMYGYLVVTPSLIQQQHMASQQVQTQSIDDAFGGLVEIEDAPLPSLSSTIPPTTTTDEQQPADQNIFQDGVTTIDDNMSANVNGNTQDAVAVIEDVDDDDGFGCFEEAIPSATTSNIETATASGAGQEEEMGTFVDASPVIGPNMDMTTATTMEGTDFTGAMTGVGNNNINNNSEVAIPEPASFGTSTMEMTASDGGVPGHIALHDNDRVSGMSGISDVFLSSTAAEGTTTTPTNPPADNLMATAQHNEDSGGPSSSSNIDPFADMAPTTNDPLPSVGFSGSNIADIQQQDNLNGDDDDFGGFESAKSSMAPTAEDTTAEAVSSSFGQPERAPDPFTAPISGSVTVSMTRNASGINETPATAGSIVASNTFDALGEINSTVQDEPLPTLDAFSTSGPATTFPLSGASNDRISGLERSSDAAVETVDDDDDDDGFGDFGSAPDPSPATNNFMPVVQPHSVQNSNDPLEGKQPFVTDTSRSVSEPFHALGNMHSGQDTGRSLSLTDDIFGDIGPVQDAPLPPLGMLGVADSVPEASTPDVIPDDNGAETTFTESVAVDKDRDDEDFGGFTDATSAENINQAKEMISFEGNLQATTIPSVGQPTSEKEDPFGAMGPPENVPLPPLSSYSYDSNDLVGDSHISGTEARETNGGNDDDEIFGGFSSVGTPQDADPFASDPAEKSAPTSSIDALKSEGLNVIDTASPDLAAGAINESVSPQMENIVESEQVGANVQEEESKESDYFGAFEAATSHDDQQKETIQSLSEGINFFTPATESVPRAMMTDLGPVVSAPVPFIGDVPNVGEIQRSMSVSETPATSTTADGDLFGGFISTDTATDSTSGVSKKEVQTDLMVIDNGDTRLDAQDGFGDFSSFSAAQPVERDTLAETTQDKSAPPPFQVEDDFGDFGDFSSANPVEHISNNQIDSSKLGDETNENLFGDFAQSDHPVEDISNNQTDSSKLGDETNENLFGDFAQSDQQPAVPVAETQGAKDFGDFTDTSPFDSISNDQTESSNPENETKDDLFGTFETQADPKIADRAVEVPKVDEFSIKNEDDFGNFAEAKHATTNENENDASFGDFGDFEGPSHASSDLQTDARSPGGDEGGGDDWGDFENASNAVDVSNDTASETSERKQLRDKIRSLSLQVPESFLLKSGFSGHHVDLVEVFEANVGTESNIDIGSVERCMQVLASVSSKLVSTWAQIMDVISEDLEGGRKVLAKAKSLSEKDLKEVITPLRTMCAGLAEYMRIARSIVASIGDVLLLDKNTMLTIDTFSHTWCSLAILEPALEIEQKWKEIRKELHPLLQAETSDATTLQEIRIRNSSSLVGHVYDHDCCNLTLQPLLEHDKATTKAPVEWQGKRFMACSANFLANRCPFFVVESK